MKQYFNITQGEDRTLSLVATDPSDSDDQTNDPFDLTGATIEVIIIDTRDGVQAVTKTGTIVTAASGDYTISLTDSDTDGWNGRYRYIAKATVSGTTTIIGKGRIQVDSDGITALADYGR